MKLDRRIKYLFTLVMIILSIIIIYREISELYNLNRIFNSIPNDASVELQDEVIQNLYKKEYKNKVIRNRIKIIQAYKKYQEGKYDESLKELDTVLANISDKMIYGKDIYYVEKLKYLNYIELKDEKKIKESFNKALSLVQRYKLYDDFADLSLKSVKNLLEINNGVEMAAFIMDETCVFLDKIKDEYKQIELLKTSSNMYTMAFRLEEALKYQLEALYLAEYKELTDEIEYILIDIAGNYILRKNYTEGIEVINNIINNYELDLATEVKLLSYLNIAYIESEMYTDCENILNILSTKIIKLEKDLREANRMWIYLGYASLYNKTGEFQKSKEYLVKMSSLYNKYEEISFFGTEKYMLIEYGNLYYRTDQYEKALENHEKAYEIAISNGRANDTVKILESIANDYYQLGEYKKSNIILRLVNKMQYEELEKIRIEKLNNVYKKILIESKDEKIDRLDRNENFMKIIIIILILITLIAYIDIKIIKSKKNKIASLNEKLKEQSLKDSLTGLYNKKGIREYMDNLEYIDNISGKYAFFMIDVDYFKLYNDGYGHIKGDEVLEAIARCLSKVCKNGFVGRYGGEEFILITKYDNEENVKLLANDVQKSIAKLNIEHKYSKVSDIITLSIGICMGRFKKNELIEAIKQADRALYDSKECGRNRYTIINFN